MHSSELRFEILLLNKACRSSRPPRGTLGHLILHRRGWSSQRGFVLLVACDLTNDNARSPSWKSAMRRRCSSLGLSTITTSVSLFLFDLYRMVAVPVTMSILGLSVEEGCKLPVSKFAGACWTSDVCSDIEIISSRTCTSAVVDYGYVSEWNDLEKWFCVVTQAHMWLASSAVQQGTKLLDSCHSAMDQRLGSIGELKTRHRL